MARANILVFVPVLVFVFLMSTIQLSMSQSTEQLIEKICRNMEDYGFCRSTFERNLKSPNSDMVALTQITIEQATDNATQTHDFIRQLLDKSQDPTVKSALSECEEAYRNIMESFYSATLSFFQKDYDSAEKYEQPTPRLIASCEDTLHAPPNSVNILDNRNRQMRILISMAVTSLLQLLGARKA